MAGTSLTALTAEQRKVFDAMPKPLQQKATRAKEIKTRFDHDEVMSRYELGQIVAEVTKDGNIKLYGEAAVPSLATFLGGECASAQQLWAYRKFVRAYPDRREVERLIGKPCAGGKNFTWSHFNVLASISGEKAAKLRKLMEEAVIEEGVSSSELARQINEHGDGESRSDNPKGRPAGKPKSVGAGLKEIDKFCLQIEKRMEGWKKVVHAGVMSVSVDKLNSKLLKVLEIVKSNLDKLYDNVGTLGSQFEDMINRVEDVQAKRKKGGKDKPEAAKPKSAKPTSGKSKSGKPTSKAKAIKPKLRARSRVNVRAMPEGHKRKKVAKHGKPSTASRIANAKKKVHRPSPA